MTSRLLRQLAPGFLLLTVVLGSCVQDRVSHRYTYQRPVYQTLAEVHALMKSGAATTLSSTGKIVVYKNYLFISDPGVGVHIYDNTNPQSPVNLAFITLFGNSDIAVTGDILYADDAYMELVAFDISDPHNVKPVKYLNNMFYAYPDNNGQVQAELSPDASSNVVSGFVTVDTTVYSDITPQQPIYYTENCVNCSSVSYALSSAAAPSASGSGAADKAGTGTTGSTAGFAFQNGYLYCLNKSGYLDVIDVSTPANPVFRKMTSLVDYSYQTLFSMNNHLFMGSYLGMAIFDATDPLNITKSGSFSHVQSCDPVIAEGNYAFVTAFSGSACGGGTDELDVLDITDITNPVLLDKYTLSNPRGLAKDGDLLLICDGKTGLGTFKIANGSKVTSLYSADAVETNDVIALNGLAIVTAPDGIYQYSYDSDGKMNKLSKIVISGSN